MIVGGIGISDRLVLEDLPASTDLQEDDLIETSGLGGASRRLSWEESYGRSYARLSILAGLLEPTAALLKVGHVLVIAPAALHDEDADSGETILSATEDAASGSNGLFMTSLVAMSLVFSVFNLPQEAPDWLGFAVQSGSCWH